MDLAQHDRRIQTFCLLILTGISIAAALFWLRPVMVPFVLAVFVALTLHPVVELLKRFGVPRGVGVLVALSLGFVVLVILGSIVSTIVTQIMDNADLYESRLQQIFDKAEKIPFLKGVVQVFEFPNETMGSFVDDVVVATATSVLGVISDGVLVLIFVFFLLIGSLKRSQGTDGVWDQVESRIKNYIFTKLLLSAATGGLVAVIFFVLGVDLALAFGFFAFVLNFVPSVGSIVATLLPLPMILFSPDTTVTGFLIAIAAPGTVQFVIGNIIEPKMMGDSMDLHPISILLALIFWGMLWGLVGMLLAVPMTAAVKIVLEKVDLTAPFAHALAGRFLLPDVPGDRNGDEEPGETS